MQAWVASIIAGGRTLLSPILLPLPLLLLLSTSHAV